MTPKERKGREGREGREGIQFNRGRVLRLGETRHLT